MNRPRNNYRMLLLGGILVVFITLNLFIVGGMIYKQHKLEAGFQQEYHEDWKQKYDDRFGSGSLDRAQTRTFAGYVGIPVISILLWLIYRQATADRSGGGSRPHAPKRYRQKSEW